MLSHRSCEYRSLSAAAYKFLCPGQTGLETCCTTSQLGRPGKSLHLSDLSFHICEMRAVVTAAAAKYRASETCLAG